MQPTVTLELTQAETSALYHAVVNDLQVGDSRVRQSLMIKVERAYAASRSSPVITTKYEAVKNGKEAPAT